jgi:predicted phosphohydrolase
MAVWAIADLHLSFGVPNKAMAIFGPQWEGYTEKIEEAWTQKISPEDLVLIAGDISWAKLPEEARPDFEWIGKLPGTKYLIKGNHDYWWGSLAKIKPILPPSCHLIQNNSLMWKDIAVGGTRLWDCPELSFNEVINYQPHSSVKNSVENEDREESLRLYQRELGRLEASLKTLNPNAKTRVVMTHYPPIGVNFEETEASRLLEKYRVDICVFGHLHNVKPNTALFGTHHGIRYYLTSCDSLEGFSPIRII